MAGATIPAWGRRRRPAAARTRPGGTTSTFRTLVLERFPGYGRAGLVAGLFLTPLVVDREAAALFSIGKVTVLWVTSLCAVAFWIAWSAERRAWLPRTGAAYAAAAVVAATGLATVFSLSPTVSLAGISTRYTGLVPTVLFAATLMAVVGLFWERPERLRCLVWAVAAAAVAVAVSVLLQQAGVDRVLWAGPVPGTPWDYPVGTIGHSNFAGAYLALAIPSLAHLSGTARRLRARSMLGVGLALDLLALWYTHSRGGMLAAVVGAGAMSLASKDRLGRWAKILVGLGIAGAVAVAVSVVWHPGSDAPPPRMAGAETLRTKTLLYRLDYWRAATNIFLHHPVVGTGPDTFYASYPSPAEAGDEIPSAEGVQPHNIFLERAAATGTLGIGSYLVLVGLTLWHGYRRRRQLAGDARRLLGCFVGVLAAYLTQGFFSIDQPPLALVGWVALGAITAIADPAVIAARRPPAAPATPPAKPASASVRAHPTGRLTARWATHGLLACGLVGLVVIGLRPLEADLRAVSGHPKQAVHLNPLHAGYRTHTANDAAVAAEASTNPTEKARLFHTARQQYAAALRIQPGDIEIMVSIANVETSWAAIDPDHFNQADAWWQRAIRHDPTNRALRRRYETELPAAKQHTVQRLETDTRINPGDAANWANLAKAYLAVGDPAKADTARREALRLDPASLAATRLPGPKPP